MDEFHLFFQEVGTGRRSKVVTDTIKHSFCLKEIFHIVYIFKPRFITPEEQYDWATAHRCKQRRALFQGIYDQFISFQRFTTLQKPYI